jgi:2-keto-3-deoxy-L-fuconate dehydrogenase
MRRQGEGGRIVVTSSVNAVRPSATLGVYGATKHAVAHLVGVMAREWAADEIAVNHVGPGWVDSNINDRSPDFATDQLRATARAGIPLCHRAITPGEIGDAVAYFASPGARMTTGAFLRVDGGSVIGKY